MQAAATTEETSPAEHPNTGSLLCTPEQANTLNHVLHEKDIVIGAYFTQKIHPQHGVSVQPASFDYIAGWFHSAIRLELNMVILHDGLPEKFMEKCRMFFSMHSSPETRGSLHFVPYSPGRFTIADERFFAARDLLDVLPDCRSAFIVDISDAWFKKNPAHLILRRSYLDYFDYSRLKNSLGDLPLLRSLIAEQKYAWDHRFSFSLFIGGETNAIGQNPWMLQQFQDIYGRQFPEFSTKPIRNCGIIGGRKSVVLTLLKTVCEEMERLNITDKLNDMAVFNYILHRDNVYSVYSNGTLNSPWKSWCKSGNHAIFHK